MNKKKNLLWLLSLLMIVSVSFTSCNKDDDDDVDLKTAIIGKWKSVSDVYYVDGVDDGDPDIYDENYYYLLEYKSDGTYTNTLFQNGEESKHSGGAGTWKIEGNKLICKDIRDDDEEETRVTINGNTLIET